MIMAAQFAWPCELNVNTFGLALTFVVPAKDCNFSCSFCAIKHRKEVSETKLGVEDYVWFLEDVVNHNDMAIMAIQGYEPLLPESWDYTEALLKTGKALDIPTSFVTNAYHLADRAEEIVELNPTGFTISIDSCISEKHDKLRGYDGAFDAAIKGIRKMADLGFADKITVSSIMFPGKRNLLEGMPKLLNELGVKHWTAKPVDRIGSATEVGRPVDSAFNILRDSQILAKISKDHDVTFIIDDELQTLSQDQRSNYFDHLLVRYFERPDGLLRLTPNGACSVGKEILKEVSSNTPVWNPSEIAPHEFVRLIAPFTGRNTYRNAA
jgi:MoaA/NifB/PqqE/SkfB family radical SAM enzyme